MDSVFSKKVMVRRGGRWSIMSDMLVGCVVGSCVVSVGAGNGLSPLAVVQVVDGKTWHFGPTLPK